MIIMQRIYLVRSSSNVGGDDMPSRVAILESQLPGIPEFRVGDVIWEETPRSTSASAVARLVELGEIGRPAAEDSFIVLTT